MTEALHPFQRNYGNTVCFLCDQSSRIEAVKACEERCDTAGLVRILQDDAGHPLDDNHNHFYLGEKSNESEEGYYEKQD